MNNLNNPNNVFAMPTIQNNPTMAGYFPPFKDDPKASSQLPNYYGFNTAFQPYFPLVTPPVFKNTNMLMHNNIKETTLKEELIEKIINIDSIDRDITKYPDPFSFKVKLHPLSDEYTKISKGKKEKVTHMPNIGYTLKNVKYASVYHIITPILKKPFTLENDRLTILNIKELQGASKFSTNKYTEKCFVPIYFDSLLNKDFISFKNEAAVKIFEIPEEVNTLTIEFLDSRGHKIKYYNKQELEELKKNPPPIDCPCGLHFDPENPCKECPENCVCNTIKHPLSPAIQVHLALVITTIDDNINLETPRGIKV